MKKILLITTFLISNVCYSQLDSICPIKIIRHSLSKDQISTNCLNLTYRNESKKDIDAFRVSVNCYNNFDEPVNRFVSDNNSFVGISQTLIKSGRKEISQWKMYLFDLATKIDTPKIISVHFTDGTKWELPQ